MTKVIVNDFLVDLVGDNRQIMALCDIGNVLKTFTRVGRSGGITWAVDDDGLCSGRDFRF